MRNEPQGIEELATKVLTTLKEMNAIGAANAIPQAEVARRCGTSTRLLQRATLHLNAIGVAVLSSCVAPFGIFIARTLDEIDAYIAQLHSRLVGNAWREKHLRDIRRKIVAARAVEPGGQTRMFSEPSPKPPATGLLAGGAFA